MVDMQGAPDTDIAGLACDSREIRPGFLFAALPGARTDGARFIDDAIRRGARAVLGPHAEAARARAGRIAFIADANPRRRYALMAARFFPAQPATLVAVTGTNGKTSVAAFACALWRRLGRQAASLGTLGVDAPGLRRPGALTTPDPVALHRLLDDLARAGVDHAVIEASSHGLAQHRCDGVRLVAAAFTNLTRDHLDYHGTEDAYFAAKARLFAELLPAGAAAVLNRDSPRYPELAALCARRGHRLVGYGRDAEAGDAPEIALIDSTAAPDGLALTLRIGRTRHRIDTRLVGGFQAHNLMCALALVIACGEDAARAAAAAEGIAAPRGRLERVARLADGAPIFVDYAHTPDALRAVLEAVRGHVQGRLHLVFGAGGDRDPGKRPQMGAVAAALADRVIVTDDNPRSEQPAAIRAAILAAAPGAREIADRALAIAEAVGALRPGDALVIAGKGHETGQIIGERTIPFDDAEVARAAVAALAGGGDGA